MKKLEEMGEFEFSNLVENTEFLSIEEEKKKEKDSKIYGMDKDEIREEFLNEEPKQEKVNILHKYLSFATGFVYTIISPVILLLGIYFVLERFIGFQRNKLVIILLLFLGLFTGYWTLFKDIHKITKKK